MKPLLTLLITGVAWLSAGPLHAELLQLQTPYLNEPLEKARHIALELELDKGQGKAILDPNSCTFNNFGDRDICTLIAPPTQEVKLTALEVADPQKLGRKIYSIQGSGLKGGLQLVVPGEKSTAAYRLLYLGDQGVERVITLEPVVTRLQRPGEETPPPEKETCEPLPFNVDDTPVKATIVPGKEKGTWTLVLKGKVRHSNTRVKLQPVTYIRQPDYWQIDVLECRQGDIVLPAIAEFTTRFPLQGATGTEGIVLMFADGKSLKVNVPPK